MHNALALFFFLPFSSLSICQISDDVAIAGQIIKDVSSRAAMTKCCTPFTRLSNITGEGSCCCRCGTNFIANRVVHSIQQVCSRVHTRLQVLLVPSPGLRKTNEVSQPSPFYNVPSCIGKQEGVSLLEPAGGSEVQLKQYFLFDFVFGYWYGIVAIIVTWLFEWYVFIPLWKHIEKWNIQP